ncbi:hypothetical protein WJ972_02385 [Achromobacter insuavis]
MTAGLTALKANGGLAEFHAAIPDFHLRYHPISTQDQRTILGDLRYETFRSTTSAAVADFYNGATELSTLKRLLDGVTLCPPESEKRAPLQAAMYTAYQSHDIPYFSRQVNNRAVYPDGLISRPLKWGPTTPPTTSTAGPMRTARTWKRAWPRRRRYSSRTSARWPASG